MAIIHWRAHKVYQKDLPYLQSAGGADVALMGCCWVAAFFA